MDPGSRAAITEVTGGGRLVGGAFVYDPTEVARDHPLDTPVALPANPLDKNIDLGGALQLDLVMEGGALARYGAGESAPPGLLGLRCRQSRQRDAALPYARSPSRWNGHLVRGPEITGTRRNG